MRAGGIDQESGAKRVVHLGYMMVVTFELLIARMLPQDKTQNHNETSN